MIKEQLQYFLNDLKPYNCKLIPVSKTKPDELLMEVYKTGYKIFGENKVQELVEKQESLPKDIEWHYIGHLQRNKVKYIAPFVSLIHAVDSLRLLRMIDKEAKKNDRVIDCLLQVHIAQESTKFGLNPDEVIELIQTTNWAEFNGIRIAGLMGMATNTANMDVVRAEFRKMAQLKADLLNMDLPDNIILHELSMGMTNDYKIALEEGSTMVRIGTAIFGARACKLDE